MRDFKADLQEILKQVEQYKKNTNKGSINPKKLFVEQKRKMVIRAKTPYLPNPSTRAGYDTRSIFKRSLNSEFSFS